MSLFRSIFDLYGSPTIMAVYGEPDLDFVYDISGDQTRVSGYQRSKKVTLEETEDGDLNRVTRLQIVFSTDPFSQWGGVAVPQIKATYEITDQVTGEIAKFAVDSHERDAYESISGSFVLVNLVQREPVSRASSGFRK